MPKRRPPKSKKRHRKDVPSSKLEDKFEMMLMLLGLKRGIHYKRQHYVSEIYSYFDFIIKRKNILIEVDGDFWHCNPKTKHKKPICEAQKKTMIKDRVKNQWCRDNNIILLRFWEDDIKNNPEEVMAHLRQVIL